MHDIKILLWDLDGVHYPSNDKIREMFAARGAALAQQYFPEMSLEDAAALTRKSFLDYHTRYDVLFRELKKDRKTVTDDFHVGLDFTSLPPVEEDYADLMEACDVKHMILTSSNDPHARRMLKERGLEKFFTARDIITIDTTYPNSKTTGTEVFHYAADVAGYPLHQIMMVEDSARVLVNAKAAGMPTTLVYAAPEQKTDYIDYIFPTSRAFLCAFVQARKNNWPQMRQSV